MQIPQTELSVAKMGRENFSLQFQASFPISAFHPGSGTRGAEKGSRVGIEYLGRGPGARVLRGDMRALR